ncbi:hypothetical protein AGMMS50239_21660 [Bacteroidia bacterium]|nr:hypothetical protein AGMMS50239_21660 [Bacteroidia bacterium]
MAQVNDYTLLLLKLKIKTSTSELKKALTHKSFYKDERGQHNSRYVFAGMYAFKGLVAEILYHYFPLDGTQLQHALGNLFKPEILDRIFVYYDLDKLIRHGIEFDAAKHRHIFVYGFLGYLFANAPEEIKKDFIQQHFLLPNSHLFTFDEKKQDLEAQCNVLARMLYHKNVQVRMQQTTDKLWQTIVSLNETCLANETSISYRYSRKKTLKKALIVLSQQAQQADHLSENYELHQQLLEEKRMQKTQQEKEKKLAAYKEKEAKKQAKRKEAKEKMENMKRLQDIKRKQAKSNAKKRKEEKEQQEARFAAQMATMSANKRRHLQDKQK